MQIKEFEAFTLKECLQQVRNDLGPEAVILETRKFRKGGLLGMGARDAVCVVAATGITVQNDLPPSRSQASARSAVSGGARQSERVEPARAHSLAHSAANAADPAAIQRALGTPDRALVATRERRPETGRENGEAAPAPNAPAAPTPSQAAAIVAARNAYARSAPATSREMADRATTRDMGNNSGVRSTTEQDTSRAFATPRDNARTSLADHAAGRDASSPLTDNTASHARSGSDRAETEAEPERFAHLERAMKEIREGLSALQREQREGHDRTVSAVVSAVAPAVNAVERAANLSALAEAADDLRFPELYQRLTQGGVAPNLAHDLLDELPDFSAWSEPAQIPLAESALRDLIARRVASAGPITLTPGHLKAVALIGPTGVGKTTTIAKLAAHFALVENKRVALLTVDTYRIAAVEQLKTYSQIIDIPIAVAYSQAEVLPAVAQFADYDLLLIDTAGRSQKNIMQVGELKTLLEALNCETHLALSASTKEQDMIEAAQRFSAARVDSLIFSKLDETSSYGALLNVADRTGIPLSYLTTGQKVPEDLEIADGGKLAGLLLC